MDFLNALLPEPAKITDLSFKNTGHLGPTDLDCKAILSIFKDNVFEQAFEKAALSNLAQTDLHKYDRIGADVKGIPRFKRRNCYRL